MQKQWVGEFYDFSQNEYLAYRIAQFLVPQNYVIDYKSDLYNVFEWLDMCSGLDKVQITPNKYDEGLYTAEIPGTILLASLNDHRD